MEAEGYICMEREGGSSRDIFSLGEGGGILRVSLDIFMIS